MARLDVTWEEPSEAAARKVAVLLGVADYDDLLAPGTRVVRLETRFELGRNAEYGDKWMSSTHATIERRGASWIVRDEGSRNGTWVNGARIEERRLDDGDLIEVGHKVWSYRVVEEDFAPRALGPTVTSCPALVTIARDLERIAPSREPVLLLGETGTGKDVVAAAVHAWSGRGELVTIDCGAVPDSLFPATFFGHRRGAYTGAAEGRTGEIVRAHRGSLFLDEIANASVAAQGSLLRVIEDGKVTPLGGGDTIDVDVRWISATNRDLLVDPAGFRPDLLRRLAGYVARLPPLRERRDDLGALAAHLLRDAGITRAAIAAPAGRRLLSSPLAGNVRQLRNVLRAAARLAGDGRIEQRHLDAVAAETTTPVPVEPTRAGGPPSADEITRALDELGGNVVRAADKLGTTARQLYRWIEKHQIDLTRFRA